MLILEQRLQAHVAAQLGQAAPADRTDAPCQLRGGDDEPVLLADILTLARTSAPLRTVVDTNASSPRLTPQSLMAADSATAAEGSAEAVRDASQAAGLRTAEAFLSLAAEAESWS